MSKKDKLLNRLTSHPKDFTYDELVTLLGRYGYVEDNLGKTSGSAVKFRRLRDDHMIMFSMHKPHSPAILKPYQVNIVLKELKKAGIIE